MDAALLIAALSGAVFGGAGAWAISLRRKAARKRMEKSWIAISELLLRETGRIHSADRHSPDSEHQRGEVFDAWKEVRQDARRMLAVFSALTEGLALLDSELRVVFCNPAFVSMFRTTEGESISPDALDPQDKSFLKRLESARSRSSVASMEVRLATTPPRDMLVMLTPYSDDRIHQGLILTALDITTRKQIDNLRSEFVANVSHELRTPLSAIRGYIETCLEPAPEGMDPPYKRFLPIIHQHALRLHALIEDLLILSRIESKAMALVLEPTPLSHIVENCIITLANEAEKKRVALINALPPMLPEVMADQRALERILLNLVENAIKYSEDESEVRITARRHHDRLSILVEDQGLGIPKEDQTRIFERFYRVDKARSRKAGGTGLGLSIVKHLVLGHGGEVWVDSEPGRGSTFFFTLPFASVRESKEMLEKVGN